MAFNISEQVLPILDQTANRQARFGYFPLFGLLLANILSQTALAKYAPLGAIRLSYEPLPEIKRPVYHHENYNSWDPASPTYGSTPSDLDTQHIHHHHHAPPTQNQIVHINDRPPEILIIDSDTEGIDQNETTAPAIFTDEFPPLPILRSSLEKPNTNEPIIAESRSVPPQLLAFLANATTPLSKKVKRGTSKYTKSRKNNKYISQKKRRPSSTTPDYYYDSYEEEEEDAATTTRRYQQKRKNPYQQRKPIIDSYEESESSISNSYSDLGNDSQEYEYDEFTTRPHKKRRRTTITTTSTHKPKRYKNKYKVRKPLKVTNLYDYEEFEYDTERIEPSTTESLKIRHQELLLRQQEQLQRQQEQLQRQQELFQRQAAQTTQPPTTTESTTDNSTTSTTTPSTTTILTVFVQGNTTGPDNTTGNNTGYGYGPSNGYESISITYSPTGVGPGPSAGGSPVYIAPSPVYANPGSSYGVPKPSYGVPSNSYSPSPSYGPPSSSYGPPSNTYGAPSTSSGFSPSVHGYYQVPFSDWYSNDVSRNSIVKKVHDIIGFDNVFQ